MAHRFFRPWRLIPMVAVACWVNAPAWGFTRPATPPEPNSSPTTVLVTKYTYDGAGRAQDIIDNKDITTRREYDALGRVTTLIENHNDGDPDTGAADKDRVTRYAYNAAGQVTEQTADVSGTTDDQATLYVYSHELAAAAIGSPVPSGGLLRAVAYPDAGLARSAVVNALNTSAGGDFVETAYYADGAAKTRKDQRGVTLTYSYDDASRRTSQHVSAGTVEGDQHVAYTYTNRGELDTVTTSSDAAGTTATSAIAHTYNGLGQLLTQSQDYKPNGGYPGGNVPTVTYVYHDPHTGSAGALTTGARMTQVTYPNGRVVEYRYGDDDVAAPDDDWLDAVSRVDALVEGTGGTLVAQNALLAHYQHNADGRLITKDLTVPDIRLDRDDDTATGYDRFGRVTRHLWERYTGGTDGDAVFDTAHTYDAASNRLDAVRTEYPLASQFYAYDDLHRLVDYDAGPEDASAVDPVFQVDRQEWTLDPLGNQDAVATLEDPAADPNPYAEADHDLANQLTARSVQAAARQLRGDDFEDSATASDWTTIAGGYTIDSGGSGKLARTGTGTMLLLHGDDPVGTGTLRVKIDGLAGGTAEAGVVFGYRSATDYYRLTFTRGGDIALYQANTLLASTATTELDNPVDLHVKFTRRGVVAWVDETTGDGGTLEYEFPSGTNGLRDGRVGLYGRNGSGQSYDDFSFSSPARPIELTGRWLNLGANAYVDAANDHLVLDGSPADHEPVLLRGVRTTAFEATFKLAGSEGMRFHFNTTDADDGDHLRFFFTSGRGGNLWLIQGYAVERGGTPTLVTATTDTAQMPSASQPVWVRVVSDGTDVEVYQATSEAGLDTKQSAGDHCFATDGTTDRFDMAGGLVGFSADPFDPGATVDDFRLRVDENLDSDTADPGETQIVESFTVDADGYADESTEHDAAGNLTYDGVFEYTYDAWNRLIAIHKAYHNGSAVVAGVVVAEYDYDGLGRRVRRAVYLDGQTDATYRDHYSQGWQLLETHNGSHDVLKQHVWGPGYVDELVAVNVNQDPGDTTEDDCEWVFFALHDAHFNVIGLVTDAGALVERYEYSPYGKRQVYSHGFYPADFDRDGDVDLNDWLTQLTNNGTTSGATFADGDADGDGDVDAADLDVVNAWIGYGQGDANDVLTPQLRAARVITAASPAEGAAYALNDVGHQGLIHDDNTGNPADTLIYNRARHRYAVFARFVQRDPLGYVDGMSLYEFARSMPVTNHDPQGLASGNLEGEWFAGGGFYILIGELINSKRIGKGTDDETAKYFFVPMDCPAREKEIRRAGATRGEQAEFTRGWHIPRFAWTDDLFVRQEYRVTEEFEFYEFKTPHLLGLIPIPGGPGTITGGIAIALDDAKGTGRFYRTTKAVWIGEWKRLSCTCKKGEWVVEEIGIGKPGRMGIRGSIHESTIVETYKARVYEPGFI